MEQNKKINYTVIAIAAIASLLAGIQAMSEPLTMEAAGILFWLVSPYFYLALMAKIVSKKASNIAVLIISLLSFAFGVWAFIDAQFIQNDAQGGLVFVVVPFYQWALVLLASLPLYFINRGKRAET